MQRYPVVERFHAPQGEGLFTGTPMAFVRLVGCSVGHAVCRACDTDFDVMRPALGGGVFTPDEIAVWALPYRYLCITGGEPLDRDLRALITTAKRAGLRCHLETSGTIEPDWVPKVRSDLWITVSPKPGYRPAMVEGADEVKVILGGLGDGAGWPTVADAARWAEAGTLVYLQPRNGRDTIDPVNLASAVEAVERHPSLRLSVQMHKAIGTR